MSTHISSWVWKSSEASGNGLLVMLALADIANDEGECWPSQRYLSERTRLSVATIKRCISASIERGELSIVSSTPGRANRYRVLTEKRGVAQSELGGVAHSELGDSSPSELGGSSTVSYNTSLHVIDTSMQNKRGSRVPQPFVVDDLMRQWARSNAPAVDLKVETENFVDHWSASASGSAVKRDWVAAWRTWMRNAQKWAVERGWKPSAVVDRETENAVRDRWLADRGVTLAEYQARWDEPGWLDGLEARLNGGDSA